MSRFNSRGRPQNGRIRGNIRGGMHNMASVSRSSGLEKDGDALKNHTTQEEYWKYVQEKLGDYLKRYPLSSSTTDKQRDDLRHSVLLLFRKLREGILASKRTDLFALKVYDLSLRISALFESDVQTNAALSYLLLHFCSESSSLSDAHSGLISQSTVVIALLHRLSSKHPLQNSFRELLKQIPPAIFPRDSHQFSWISKLAVAIGYGNYARVDQLTRVPELSSLLESEHDIDYSLAAISTLVESLRKKVRIQSWIVIRTAYREITCAPGPSDCTGWLGRSLFLGDAESSVQDWLKARSEEGHAKVKEGSQGKWVLNKPIS